MTTPIRAKVAAIVEQLDAVASLHPSTSHLLRHLATDGQAALRGEEVPLDVVSAALTRWYAAGMPDLDRPAAPSIRYPLVRADEALERAWAEIGEIVEHGNRHAEDHGLKASGHLLAAQEHIYDILTAMGGPVPSPGEAP